ncbi:hypothetical protein [Microbispora sp. NPDC046933]|uniref:hypothetical protein n=1 Tax=Microbispora sp. NPDC046933 TaxID=3155618 RepID=UPI0033D59D4E
MNWNWAGVGRVILVLLTTWIVVNNGAATTDGGYLSMVAAVALLCGAALLVPRLPWPVASLLTTAATAWWGWITVPLFAIALYDLAARRRLRVAVGCAVVALTANLLLSRHDVSLWLRTAYGMVLLLLLAVVIGLWRGNRRRLLGALASEIDLYAPRPHKP